MSKTKELKRPRKAPAKRQPAAKSAIKTAKTKKTAPQKATAKRTTTTTAAKKTPVKNSVPAKKTAKSKTSATSKTKTTVRSSAKTPVTKRAAGKTIKKATQAKPTVKKSATPAKEAPAKTAAAKTIKKPRSKSRRPKKSIVLPKGYRPSDKEPFMSDEHQAYFREKLVAWKEDIIRQTRETLADLTSASEQHADVADRATSETDRALELRARDRQRKLVGKINSALGRIDEGSYGYCEETGEAIGLRRLEARPIATLSLEAQERHERRERVFRED